jgi:hypothetical protein
VPGSTSALGHRASARAGFFPSQEISPDRAGCWLMPREKLAYPGASGFTFRYYLALEPPAVVTRIERQKVVHHLRPDVHNTG